MNPFGDFEDQYRDYSNAKIAVLPVPYDKTSTWVKGADRGPEAFLEASLALENYDVGRLLRQSYFSTRSEPSSSRTMVSPSFTETYPSPVSTDSMENPIQKYGARTLSPHNRFTSS